MAQIQRKTFPPEIQALIKIEACVFLHPLLTAGGEQ
jgi:hypothetical protein